MSRRKIYTAWRLWLFMIFILGAAQFTYVAPQSSATTSPMKISLTSLLDQAKEEWNVRCGFDRAAFDRIMVPTDLMGLPKETVLARMEQEFHIVINTLSPEHMLLRLEDDQAPSVNVGKIQGTVIDGLTGEPLVSAAVYTSDLRAGVTTDEEGRFELDISSAQGEGTYLLARYLGYQVQSLLFPTDGQTVRRDFSLVPEVLNIPAIIVKSTLPSITKISPGAYTVHSNKALLLNGPMGSDPLRQLQLLPGVAAFDDLSGQPKIRGASVEGNQFLLNSMSLLNVDHFFGIYSAINPYVIDQISLHKTYFPLPYGGRSSAVIALQSDIPDSPLEGTLEISPLTANGVVRGAFRSGFNYALALRRSISNLGENSLYHQLYQEPGRVQNVMRSANLEIRPEFSFEDLYAQVGWQGRRDSFFIQFYASSDHSNYAYDRTFLQIFPRDTIRLNEAFAEDSDWSNQAWSTGYQLKLNSRWTSQWFLGQSNYQKSDLSELNNYALRLRPGEQNSTQVIQNSFNNRVQTWQMRWNNQWFYSPRLSIDAGLEAEKMTLSNQLQTNLTEQIVNIKDQTWNSSAWAGVNYQHHRWQLGGGMRLIHDQLTAKTMSSPRMQVTYQVNDAWQTYVLAGIYPQWMRTSLHENPFNQTYQFWILANRKNIPVLTSQKAAVGSIFKYRQWEWQAEVFYDQYEGLLQHVLTVPGVKIPGETILPRYRLFTGKGETYGADLWLKGAWKYYTGWISYTWSKATQNYAQLNQGRSFPAEDDRRHQLKWINTLSLGRFSIHASFIYASGKPYLDYNALRITSLDRSRINLSRFTRYLAPYRRVDVGVAYKQPWKNSSFTASFSVFNLFDETNVKYNQFIYGVTDSGRKDIFSESYVAGQEITLLPFTPSLALKWQF